jgi:hypothetical protein
MKDQRTVANISRDELLEALQKEAERRSWNKKRKRKELEAVKCPHCEQPFYQVRQWQRFCSDSCRVGHFLERKGNELLSEMERLIEENKELKNAADQSR